MEEDASRTLEFRGLHEVVRGRDRRTYCLIVVDGPDKGATFPLSTGNHVIGRAPECEIVVEDSGISRRHATVQVKAHGDVLVHDLESTNGLFIDGQQVSNATMEAGQTLMVGPGTKLRLELASPSLQLLLQELFRNATRDNLTGLFNRRGFEERLDIEFETMRRHRTEGCLAVLDLDRFKSINDSRGHAAGDRVLATFGSVLRESLRLGDLACRWGGEEFAIYLRGTPLPGALTALERLRERFAGTAVVVGDDLSLLVTFSGGVVDLRGVESWRMAFEAADEALYQAKSEGRDRVCVGAYNRNGRER